MTDRHGISTLNCLALCFPHQPKVLTTIEIWQPSLSKSLITLKRAINKTLESTFSKGGEGEDVGKGRGRGERGGDSEIYYYNIIIRNISNGFFWNFINFMLCFVIFKQFQLKFGEIKIHVTIKTPMKSESIGNPITSLACLNLMKYFILIFLLLHYFLLMKIRI